MASPKPAKAITPLARKAPLNEELCFFMLTGFLVNNIHLIAHGYYHWIHNNYWLLFELELEHSILCFAELFLWNDLNF